MTLINTDHLKDLQELPLSIFDPIWYLEQNPDVTASGLSPHEHYVRYGESECRSPVFDRQWYLQEYPDVAQAGLDPYIHYIQYGKNEGRHPAFNRYWYLNEYVDVAKVGMDPYEHYLLHGKQEGRYPSFDRHWYLKNYPDVAIAGLDPYDHYVRYGKLEGRHPAYDPKKVDLRSYGRWISEFDTLTDGMRKGMHVHISKLKSKPLISVVMPVYNSNIDWLKQAIVSVQSQIYQNWELCVADDASSDPVVRAVLQQCAELDPRIKLIFRETNGHISAASNSALSLATGEWIALLDHDDLLAEHALFWVIDAINNNPNCRMIYSDDDNINERGERSNPYFKCNWNTDLFYSHNLFGHLGVYCAKLVHEVGGFRIGMEGSQDYDLALRCLEKVQTSQIHHVPRVLYHWRVHTESTAFSLDAKPYAMIAGAKAINEHFQRQDIDAKVEFLGYAYKAVYALPVNQPLVSLIIPTRNGYDLLKQCVESIQKKTSYINYEIIIVDNGSDDPATISYLKKIADSGNVRVIRDERPFNYSALNNSAVTQCHGELVGLINNDIEVISPAWLTEMVSHAIRPGIGAVGARLWYPNDTLQHGGVILGIGGAAGHSHKGLPADRYGYFNRAVLTQSYSAVTAACLIIRKSIYEQVRGLNEIDLSIAYNDVDFCLRVREAGYKNIWTPYAELYHYESATRGHEDTPEKKARLAREMSYLKARWGDLLLNDPSYSPNLTLDKEDFSYSWPPRVQSNESFLIPYDSEFQCNDDFLHQKTDIKAIAFYLPQFHRCKQNDEWWGEGFTEWTNTKRAKPRFHGHYQPREPHDDIGYYDLSDAEAMRKQAILAREHGVHGFCFYHYWFSGDRILEKPVDLLLDNLDIDINFCLCWANENWTRTWDGLNSNLLLEQKYLPNDPLNFIRDIRMYLKDPRYICIDNKPIIIVYKSNDIPNAIGVFSEWRKWWSENEGGDLLIWCVRTDPDDIGLRKLQTNIDAVVEFPPAIFPYNIDNKRLPVDTSACFHHYQKMVFEITSGTQLAVAPTVDFYRSVMLGWDNSARRKDGWSSWLGFSLSIYYEWLRHTINYTRNTFPVDRRFVFINAWNEWAEGTYLEPDRKYGYASINTTSKALFDLPLNSNSPSIIPSNEIVDGGSKTPAHGVEAISAINRNNRLAVVVHVFYLDVFLSIVEYLKKTDKIDIYLYATCSRALEKDLIKVLKEQSYEYTILLVENRGRDVLPFLKIMPQVIGDGHEYVLKIHTKKTTHRNDGNLWRAELFDQLIDSRALELSFDYLKNNVDLGVLGPSGHVIPMKDYYGSNEQNVLSLATRLGLTAENLNSLNFVAGTMFTARIKAIEPLLELGLRDDDFEEEAGQTDGTLAHAIERAFSASCFASGLRVSSISDQVNCSYTFAVKTPYS
jgi:lipopolysaccharide biosynthesis protein/glycosyltransferase involved in cell wall biosynthesis